MKSGNNTNDDLNSIERCRPAEVYPLELGALFTPSLVIATSKQSLNHIFVVRRWQQRCLGDAIRSPYQTPLYIIFMSTVLQLLLKLRSLSFVHSLQPSQCTSPSKSCKYRCIIIHVHAHTS